MDRVRAVVVGCGSISDIYMTNLTNGKFTIMELVGCCDLVQERMEAAADKFGIRAMTLEEVCADDSVDMVINLTTPAAHYPIIKRCLEAGKHVFSEKMIAVDLWQGKELVDLANEKGLYLGVAPDTFLGASCQTAKYIVDAGLIGKPISAQASISRDYAVYGEFLPHLYKKGAGIGFDMGGYYLTALASILGPAESLSAYTAINEPHRVNTRIGSPLYGQEYDIEVPNVLTAAVKYKSGVLGTVNMTSDSILDETYRLEIYGTDGILYMGNPNEFGDPVYIRKVNGEKVAFPATHGFAENSRGVGAAEMAWSIKAGRKNRASKEMAFHVFEMMHGIMLSAESGERYCLESTFDIPAGLPEGYIGDGGWTRKEESALI